MAVILPIEPKVLVWARETAGYPIAAAAEKLRLPAERLAAWEAGEARPGISHLRRLASLYKRPLAALMLAEPPIEPADPTDFRTISSKPARFTPETRFAIRNARRWQEIASEIVDEQGRLDSMSYPSSNMDDEPEKIANFIREWLRITNEDQLSWSNARDGFKSWRNAIEGRNLLVFVLPMPRYDCRGFSLWQERSLAAIVVNRREVEEARSFTLIHELAHLMLRNTGVCDQSGSTNGHQHIERFCNQVAGFALAPREFLNEIVVNARRRRAGDSVAGLVNVVRLRCRASRHAAAIRLEEDRHIPVGSYEALKAKWSEEDWVTPGGGGPVPMKYRILSEKGGLYSTIVVGAWKEGMLSSMEASRFMDTKTAYLDDVAAELEI